MYLLNEFKQIVVSHNAFDKKPDGKEMKENSNEHFFVIAELRCSAISSPISPSIDYPAFIPQNSNEHSGDFDAHTTSFQPLIQRNSMGNIKWDYGCNGRCPSEAPQVVTGTKGLKPH